MTGQTQYSVRRASLPEDRDAIIRLWQGNLGDPDRAERKLQWFYETSPTGSPIILLLESSDPSEQERRIVVGVASAGLRRYRLGDRVLSAGVLVDLAVLPQHRTLFPALLLQKTMMKKGLESLELLYGFPNAKAAPVFARAGYQHIADMVRYVRVVRGSEYLRRRLPLWVARLAGPLWDLGAKLRLRWHAGIRSAVALEWGDTGPACDSAEGDTLIPSYLIHGARDERFLRWRFATEMTGACEFVTARDRNSSRKLGSWIVEGKDDVLHVRDVPFGLLVGRWAVPAWSALFRQARTRGYRAVSFECVGPSSVLGTLHRLRLLERSRRPLYGVALQELEAGFKEAGVYLTAADEDE